MLGSVSSMSDAGLAVQIAEPARGRCPPPEIERGPARQRAPPRGRRRGRQLRAPQARQRGSLQGRGERPRG